MKHAITFLLCLSLAQCGLSPAWADTVEIPDAPDPFFEPGGPDASDLASLPPSTDLAMLYHVPADGDAGFAPATPVAFPLSLQAGTDQETRLSVDTRAISERADREGWPTWAKVTVIVGGVAVVALTSWAIVEATQHHGDHTSGDDASIHLPVTVGGQNNHVEVNYDSHKTSALGGYR